MEGEGVRRERCGGRGGVQGHEGREVGRIGVRRKQGVG